MAETAERSETAEGRAAVSKTGAAAGMVTNVYLNVGGEGNPQFVLGMADGAAISKTGAAAGEEVVS